MFVLTYAGYVIKLSIIIHNEISHSTFYWLQNVFQQLLELSNDDDRTQQQQEKRIVSISNVNHHSLIRSFPFSIQSSMIVVDLDFLISCTFAFQKNKSFLEMLEAKKMTMTNIWQLFSQVTNK